MKQIFRPSLQKIVLSLLIFFVLISVLLGGMFLFRSVPLKPSGEKRTSLMGDPMVPDLGNDSVNLLVLALCYLVSNFVSLPVPFLSPVVFSYIMSCLIMTRLEKKKIHKL